MKLGLPWPIMIVAFVASAAIAGCGGADFMEDDFTLSATPVSSTEVDIQWPTLRDARDYVLFGAGGRSWSFSPPQRTFRVTGLAPSTSYCFYLVAFMTGGVTANRRSNEACAVTLPS